MKKETGVMIMKNGKAWGTVMESGHGHGTIYGWVAPEDAPIHDPQFCKEPTDVTYEGSHYQEELSTAKVIRVERKTEVLFQVL